jgi:hypothetical protein
MFTVDLHFVPVELKPLLMKGTHYIGRLLIHLFNNCSYDAPGKL